MTRLLFLLSLSLQLFSLGHRASAQNVILIVADDMGYGDLGSINGGLTHTPRLDQLASESVVFENAYSASPVCAPARAALFTGRYPHRTGVVTLNQEQFPALTRLRLDETLVSDRFAANGYMTGLVGKWHSGYGEKWAPQQRGFAEAVYFKNHLAIPSYFDYTLIHGTEEKVYQGGPYLTDVFTEQAIAFVERHQAEPFFLHLAHYAPHRPLSAPEDVIASYRNKGLTEEIATAYAMIEVMDRGIGQLIDKVDELGLGESTIIIFTSDNGPDPIIGERFNADLFGEKYWVNEGGIKVPFFVRWSGRFEPRIVREVIHFIDVTPSLIELCSLDEGPQGRPMDGSSFAYWLSPDFDLVDRSDRFFWQWNRKIPDGTHNAAVREGNWKLVRPFVTRGMPKGPSQKPAQLFHVSDDPGETRNLSDQKPNLVESLSRSLDAWFFEVETDRNRPGQ